ncbi:MAG: trigger factor, partial [Bilifractor sp.]|nr:trigger factor [Bilifractor sp.]
EMVQNFARRLQAQGMSLEQYMKYTGADVNQMRAQVKPQAEIQIRNELVLEKIAETEKIEVTDEDVNKEIENMAKAYNMKVEDISKLIDDEQKESIRKELAVQKAADLIADNAVEVEKKEEEAAPAEEKKEEE